MVTLDNTTYQEDQTIKGWQELAGKAVYCVVAVIKRLDDELTAQIEKTEDAREQAIELGMMVSELQEELLEYSQANTLHELKNERTRSEWLSAELDRLRQRLGDLEAITGEAQ